MLNTESHGFDWTEREPDSVGLMFGAILAELRTTGTKSVVDLGCGNGAIASRLASAGFTVHGIDADAKGIRVAQGRKSGATFERGSFQKPSSRAFDAAISSEVIEHLYAPHELIRYAASCLAPGGRFIVTTPYHGYLKNFVIAALGKWDSHTGPDFHGGHIKFFSKRSLTKMLKAGGFTVERFRGVGRAPYLWHSMVLTAVRNG